MSALPPPYPLRWPEGKRRTPSHERRRGEYSSTGVGAALDGLAAEMKRCGVRSWELTSNYSGRGDARGRLPDPGAALWFLERRDDITRPQSLMAMACDRFDMLDHNIRGLSLTMQRLRLVDEIGAYSFVQAVEGARALPPPDAPWWQVLQVVETAPLEVAEASYRTLCKSAHPDAGGDAASWARLQRAVEAARKAKARV